MLGCLAARERRYGKGARIHRMGDVITTVGLVLEGGVRIESVDVWGNVSVLGVKGAGGMFGEAYAAVPDEPLMVDVVAAEDTTVLFLNLSKVLATCSHACPHHSRTSTNMTAIIARQSLALSRRILHVAPKTIRGKVLAYLSDVAAGRLPGRRPQRPFRRALAHAEGGPHRDPPEPFHLEVETFWGDWRFFGGDSPKKRHTEAPASPAAPRGQPRASRWARCCSSRRERPARWG